MRNSALSPGNSRRMASRKMKIGVILFLNLAMIIFLSGCPNLFNSNDTASFSVVYHPNGATAGTVPVDDTKYLSGQSVTVCGNSGTLSKDGCTFADWNTKTDGTGESYVEGDSFAMGSADVVLYARWSDSLVEVPASWDGTYELEDIPGVSALSIHSGAIFYANGDKAFPLEALEGIPDVVYSFSEAECSVTVSGFMMLKFTRDAESGALTMWSMDGSTMRFLLAEDESERVAMPSFSVSAGTIEAGTQVDFLCSTSDVTFHYTTDGSVPTSSSPTGTSYTVTETTTLRLIAVKEGMEDSYVVSAVFTIGAMEQVQSPSFDPAPGAVSQGARITFSCPTAGATIRYTTDGSTPTTSSTAATVYLISCDTHLKIAAFLDGMTPSEVVDGYYTIYTEEITVPDSVGVIPTSIYLSKLPISDASRETIRLAFVAAWERAYKAGIDLGEPAGTFFADGVNRAYIPNLVQVYMVGSINYVVAYDFAAEMAYRYREGIPNLLADQSVIFGIPAGDEYEEAGTLYQDFSFGRAAISVDGDGAPSAVIWEADAQVLAAPTVYAGTENTSNRTAYIQGQGTIVLGTPMPSSWGNGVEARYTLDGSTPTASSSLWPSTGVSISEGTTATVKVKAFDGTGRTSPTTTRVFQSFAAVDGEMIGNGDFSHDGGAWNAFGNGTGNTATGHFDESLDAFTVDVSSAGTSDWNVMCVNTAKLTIRAGHSYKLVIDAWADAPRTVYPSVQEYGVDSNGDGDLWDRHFTGSASLGTSKKTFTYYFTIADIPVGGVDSNALLNIMGGIENVDYHISRASLIDLGDETPNGIDLTYVQRIPVGAYRTTAIAFSGGSVTWAYVEIPEELSGGSWKSTLDDSNFGYQYRLDLFGPDSMTTEASFDPIFQEAGIYFIKITALDGVEGSIWGSIYVSLWKEE